MTEPAAPSQPERASAPADPALPTPDGSPWPGRWQRFSAASLKAFHAYAAWLVSISWWRFIALSVALLIIVGILHDNPPFTWTVSEQVDEPATPRTPKPPKPPRLPAPPQPGDTAGGGNPGASGKDSPIRIERPRRGQPTEGVDISIGKDGIRITPRPAAGAAPASAASPASAAASGSDGGVHITLPPGATSEAVREAVAEARRQIEEAVREARDEAEQAQREADQARAEAERAIAEATGTRKRTRKTRVGIGDAMMQLTLLWILGSAILKATYKGRMQAERKAARATETAEAESLKRQVVEARMAAMQAQVEPHFLFNTLASIDHLIETDPARASQMQRNLIALLRASMPTMREAGGAGGTTNGVRDLGRELAVIRPYLEILKVRMEERLATELDVPEGLHSAEFPPMMIQTLVENAIKHGLEPKPEGGKLSVKAQIVHGNLQVVVADTGLGFGKAATAGTGVGLANIRERLQLLYGTKASLTVAENTPSGTVVRVTVPYKTVEGAGA
ncbi:MAG: histidine kinase [Rubrivivax sp.]|nr:histidine kinase [Rubrivivax sp.]